MNYRSYVYKILLHHTNENSRLYESIEIIFKSSTIPQKDKNLITYTVQGVIRRLSSIDSILDQLIKKYSKAIPLNVKIILRIGVYQINHMESPNYATINELVQLTKKKNNRFYKLVNAVLRRSITFKSKLDDSKISNKAKLFNHPEWLYKKWTNDYNTLFAQNIADWNNTIPEVWFRINSNLYSTIEFEEELKKSNISFIRYLYNSIYYKTSNPSILINNEIFKDGMITVQNPFSGFICNLLNPKSDELVIDACAAPGGKTAYISELMKNKGKIFAFDINQKRIILLKKTLERMKINNVIHEVKDVASQKLPKADKILLDVPCTGTGVLNKYPDIKWKKSFSDIKEMVNIQKNILSNASKYLRRGGIIVYSTCSIEKEENEEIITSFLNKNNNYSIKKIDNSIPNNFINKFGQFKTTSFIDEIDGGFATILVNNAN